MSEVGREACVEGHEGQAPASREPGPYGDHGAELAAYVLWSATVRPKGFVKWTRVADATQAALLDELWTGDRFVARSAHGGATWTSASLLDLMPVVLGEHLPQGIGDALADRIESHLTAYGLATELPTSPHYLDDGYWRGPIWAPSTVLIEDGLRRAGHDRLADEISTRFRALCETSGFAENFDALTGVGLRDRAYTWTAAGYRRSPPVDGPVPLLSAVRVRGSSRGIRSVLRSSGFSVGA